MKLTQDQNDWLYSKIEGKDILYMGVHGSILYGLDHPESDIDIKAIYLPSTRDLIRGQSIKTFNYKNEDLDIEIEVKSITSFLKSAASCDTNCIDLLHAPDEATLITSDMWKSLKLLRSGMYAKNMKGIIGYIKTHSKKYTNKIDRLTEVKSLLLEINTTLTNTFCTIEEWQDGFDLSCYKYIKVVTSVKDGEQAYLEVCGKKYSLSWDINKLKTAMEVEVNRYGKRSNKGVSKGIDGKSLSHALRVLYQLKEIILTKDLKFPLKDAVSIKQVKMGEVTDVTKVLDQIDTLYEDCILLLSESDFPEEVDISGMEKIIDDFYFNQ